MLATIVDIFFCSSLGFVAFMAGRTYEVKRLLRREREEEARHLAMMQKVRDDLRKRG